MTLIKLKILSRIYYTKKISSQNCSNYDPLRYFASAQSQPSCGQHIFGEVKRGSSRLTKRRRSNYGHSCLCWPTPCTLPPRFSANPSGSRSFGQHNTHNFPPRPLFVCFNTAVFECFASRSTINLACVPFLSLSYRSCWEFIKFCYF